jgi:hypothetical protein
MNCRRCRTVLKPDQVRCPQCGEPNPETSGLFQTSTVLISAGRSERVYRSVDEVPSQLRYKLLKSTASPNSATILIADRRGRREIAKAMRKLPGPAQRRLKDAIQATETSAIAPQWLTARRKHAITAIMLLLALLAIGFAFYHSWQ